jgi:hypothetical protein
VTDDGRELRVSWCDKNGHEAGFFAWPRYLLDQLEGGAPVRVRRVLVELTLWERDRDQAPGRVRLSFARGLMRVQVSPDDRIMPAVENEN